MGYVSFREGIVSVVFLCFEFMNSIGNKTYENLKKIL